jgi:hypothetical protein
VPTEYRVRDGLSGRLVADFEDAVCCPQSAACHPAFLAYSGMSRETPSTSRTPGTAIRTLYVLAGSGSITFSYSSLAFRKSNGAARRLLMASIVYLPLVFSLVILDRFQ